LKFDVKSPAFDRIDFASVPLRAMVAILAGALVPAAIGAQCAPGGPPDPRLQPDALVGIVTDAALRPIQGAEVLVGEPQRQTRTGPDGQFIVKGVSAGAYKV
jgi:hypothetical protein